MMTQILTTAQQYCKKMRKKLFGGPVRAFFSTLLALFMMIEFFVDPIPASLGVMQSDNLSSSAALVLILGSNAV